MGSRIQVRERHRGRRCDPDLHQPTRAPVVWLVSGDVTINGTVSVNGARGAAPPALAEPGPGGFRGGMGYDSGGVRTGSGLGPGGGAFDSDEGFGGSYGAQSPRGPSTYGNPSLVPLLGGSSGGGNGNHHSGGGGGALLISAAGVITRSSSANHSHLTGKPLTWRLIVRAWPSQQPDMYL